MILKSIYEEINVNNLEKAYELIISNETRFIENSMYWALRGDLCFKIHEYISAIDCYQKSIELNSVNIYPLEKMVYSYEKINNKVKENEYLNIINSLKKQVNKENVHQILCEHFINTKQDKIKEIIEDTNNFVYLDKNKMIKENELISLDEYCMKNRLETIIVPFKIDYINNVRYLAKNNIKSCIVAYEYEDSLYFVPIDENTMNYIKNENYKNTITMSMYNRGDSNVYALNKYINDEYREKYNVIVVEGSEVFDLTNMVKIPLISSMTVSGHGVFLSYPYPQLIYNLEVGHGPMSFKASGNMEKTYKNFAFTPQEYKNVDKMCATSTMDTILLASFVNIPENKFLISGMPRTDTLLRSNGKENLKKLIKTSIDDKKVIFNMPTFHKHESSGKEDGNSTLNSFMKVHNFNYTEFDEFLDENNLICVMKAHHTDENLLKSKEFKANNIYFIFNDDLAKLNLDLYEILNASDLLITDYSTIYSDFLFMNKPTIFVNTDIEEYRAKRGLALEPYEFWTAGPKVQEQDKLQKEIMRSLDDKNYYKEKREELRTVYHANFDDKSSDRVWKFIDETMIKLNSSN